MKRLLLLFVAAMLVGCASEVVTPLRVHAPRDVADIAFRFGAAVRGPGETSGDGDEATAIVRDELRRAGYLLVEGDEGADAAIVLRLAMTKSSTPFSLRVNGKELGGYEAVATLDLEIDGRVATSASTSFSFTQAEIADARQRLQRLVAELNATPALPRIAAHLRQVRHARAAEHARSVEEEERRRYRLWRETYVIPCAEPQQPTDCDALEQWLDEHRHREGLETYWIDGSQVLRGSREAIARLRDDAAWSQVGLRECRSQATESACEAVRGYLQDHPTGRHRDEAQTAIREMEAAEAQREEAAAAQERMRIAGQEAARQKAEADAAHHRREAEAVARRQECMKACDSKCAGYLQQSDFNACRTRCSDECR